MKRFVIRFILINLIFGIIFLLFSNVSFADTTYEDLIFNYNGVTYNISNPNNFSTDFGQKFGIVLLDNGELRFYYSEHSDTIFTGWYNDDGSINIDANCQFYYGQIIDNEWDYISFVRAGDFGTFNGTLIYTNQEIVYDKEGNVFFSSSSNNPFYINPIEETFIYPQILSIEYSSEYYNIYNAYVSLDGINWEIMSKESVYIDENGTRLENSPFVFYYNVFENGTYYIRLFDDSSGLYIYDDSLVVTNLAFDVYYSTEETKEPIYVYSDDFAFDNYLVYVSKDKYDWNSYKLMNSEIIDYEPGDISTGQAKERYWCYITEPGIYYFIFVECSSEEGRGDIYYVKKEINNIIIDNYMSDSYVPIPNISLDFNEEEQCFVLKTQSILLDKALNMKCFYTTDFESTNVLDWNQMEIDFYNNTLLGDSQEAYFYFNIPVIGASDTDYRIVFYNYFSNAVSETIIYEFRYDKAIDYVENELKVNLSFSVKFNNLINYFKDRFGFLTYPIEFTTNLLNKLLNIEYSEPIIRIPELYIPGTTTKIFNGYEYNFNTILENQAILTIYNIYLIAVDFIIIIALIALAYKVIMEVLNK